MLFSSYQFILIFLPATYICFLLAYRFGGWKMAVHVLAAASLAFYAMWGIKLFAILLGSLFVRRQSAEMRSEFSTLEDRVRERTAQLDQQIAEREAAEAQLRQAQKMEVIGQLTGGVAHDFNNLLAIIMGDLEAVRDRLSADEFEDLAAGAWEAAERGAALVRRLLAVSRRQPLSPREVDANALVAELEPLLERVVPRRVKIEAVCEAGLWPCFVDRSQLENVILNLVVNARDAMPEGGTVTIETRNRRVEDDEARALHLAPGDYVELSVTDTGMGMPEEVRARALDPFFTTKEIGKGSGLGLAMAHGMARQSGGHLELHSEVGVGTRVRLVLPRAEDGARKSSAPLVEVS